MSFLIRGWSVLGRLVFLAEGWSIPERRGAAGGDHHGREDVTSLVESERLQSRRLPRGIEAATERDRMRGLCGHTVAEEQQPASRVVRRRTSSTDTKKASMSTLAMVRDMRRS